MFRASASSRAIVCSAAVITFDWGALATTIPRLVAAGTSTLSTPTPARPTARSRVARPINSASSFVAERIRIPSYSSDPLGQLLAGPPGADLDVEVLRQEIDTGLSDLLRHQHPRLAVSVARGSPALLQNPVDARRQRFYIGGIGGREHRHAELVSSQLAVWLDVDDPVGPQRRRQLGRVDLITEVDRSDDERALGRVGDERGGVRRAARPSRRGVCAESVVRATMASSPPRSSIQLS